MNILALDIGDRYIGMATLDHVDTSLAYRYGTLDRTREDVFARLREIVKLESITTFVLGVPYHVEDGSETQQTHKTKEFIASLKEALGDSLVYTEVDETLTSQAARDALTRQGESLENEHAEAAKLMLEEYLANAR